MQVAAAVEVLADVSQQLAHALHILQIPAPLFLCHSFTHAA
jgi:hypothetical protein